MIFSIEALYALHRLQNDGYSEDLFPFLFPEVEGKEK